MYCVRNSSGRHTSVAPCCAASRMRATAFPRFASVSSLMLICTSPTLNCDGNDVVMGMKNNLRKPLAPPRPSYGRLGGKSLDDHAAAERARHENPGKYPPTTLWLASRALWRDCVDR